MIRTTPSPQTLRMLAAVAMREFSLRHHQGAALPVQTPAPATPVTQMCDLPHVARHVLRFMDKVQLTSAQMLRRETGRERDMLPALGALIRFQLIEPVHRSYRITPAGTACVNAEPGQILLRRTAFTH
ncbi:hypothetical protein [Polaromonas sp. CG_23.6]|uniref:hypothetical protein n=1 Tax=Polaromonas sp. CG_23.6 TaxID=2760709 RepID=UPI002476FB11|nr:hypothetical protein [Polaromonas sp. CG_23.6]MDH6185318.1 hypothetical protein [Polaromonas sp. CG_23.6]